MLPAPSVAVGFPPARPILGRAFARGIRPPRRRTVSQWAEDDRFVSRDSGSPIPGKWSNSVSPEMVEVMDCLTPASPGRTVTLKKSAQVAGSESGINLFGHVVVDDPGPMMIVLPTTDEVKKYVRVKLQPAIDATKSLKERVRDQKSRDEDSSTTTFKKFDGGFAQMVGANSSSGLQMVSIRVLILEEVSEYPADVDGRGDPVEMAIERCQGWEGREKIFFCSTPGLDGVCRVSQKYEISDQRRRYLPCPHCGMFQPLQWARVDREAVDPVYICAANGCVIEHGSKTWMRQRGVWLKCYPGDDCPPEIVPPEDVERHRARSSGGRDPGFWINGLYSPFRSWSALVKIWRNAQGDQAKLKSFTQQGLGEAWKVTGEAPDHQKLFDARSKYNWRQVPPGALFLTGATDVQGDRLEWAVYAFGPSFSSWLIDKGVIEGDPNGPAVWTELDKVYSRTWPDQYGTPWSLDAFGVDAGYLSNRVYRWVMRYVHTRKVFALKGVPGWASPPIGAPGKVGVDADGKKIGSTLSWPVGTWNQKSEIYHGMQLLMAGPDKETGRYPAGTAFFGDTCDLFYCEQLTAEQVITRKAKSGATEMVWEVVTGRRNEALDVAVYSRALAHHLADGMTPDQWLALAAQRGAKPEDVQRDMGALWAPLPAETAPAAAAAASEPAAPAAQETAPDQPAEDWLGDRAKNFWN